MWSLLGRSGYHAIRRLGVVDITGVWWLATGDASARNATNTCRDQAMLRESGCRIRELSMSELDDLKRASKIHPMVGQAQNGKHRLFGVETEDRIVSFVWLATNYVPANQNFSRSQHLGSSLTLPAGVGFLFNAWTDPTQRGRGWFERLLSHLAGGQIETLRLHHLLATIDWTNRASRRAFAKCGFTKLGNLWRLGRSGCQLTIAPRIDVGSENNSFCELQRRPPDEWVGHEVGGSRHSKSDPREECRSCAISRVLACEHVDPLSQTEIARDVPGLRISW